MRTKRRRTEIVTETETLLILKKKLPGIRQGRCVRCNADVVWIARDATALVGIFDLTESNSTHSNGDYLCSRSLIEEIRKGVKI